MGWPFSKDCFINTLIHKLRHTCWFWTSFQYLHLKFLELLVLALTYFMLHLKLCWPRRGSEKKGPLKFHLPCSDISRGAFYWEIELNNLAITNMCPNNMFQHPCTLPPRAPLSPHQLALAALGMVEKLNVQCILAQFHGEDSTPEQSCPSKCLVSYICHSKLTSSHTQKSKKQQVKLNNKSVA